jgi:hypothetical protein
MQMVGLAVATGIAVGVWLTPTAGAQIASVVRPPSAPRTVASRPAAYDTSTAQVRHPTTQLTGLTAWVDSAVAANESTSDVVAPTPAAGHKAADPRSGDTRATGAAAAASPSMRTASVRFRDGGPAPDTASPLPAIALVGLVTLGGGLAVSAASARGRRRE